MEVQLECKYELFKKDDPKTIYTCFIEYQNIPENAELKFTGQHESEKSNADVNRIWFENCDLSKIPKGLTKVFPKSNVLKIEATKLKNLSKQDLAEYKNFRRLYFDNNYIEFLPGDLFEGFKNLEQISFIGNCLIVIEPNILDGLENLQIVDFSDNPNYDHAYSYILKMLIKQSIEDTKKYLFEKFFKTDQQNVKNYVRKLQQKNLNFQKIGEKLTEKVKSLETKEKSLTQEVQQLKKSEENLKNDLEVEKFKKLTFELNNGMLSDVKKFIQDENFKDFKIKKEDHEFHVHKFLLAARSPTLAEMFRENPDAENLNLVDIPIEIFDVILKFIYTDELPDEDIDFMRLFAAAGRLKIEELKNFAGLKFLNGINVENAIEAFKLSNKFCHHELKQKAFNEIKKLYQKIDFKDEWISDVGRVVELIEIEKKMSELMEKFESLKN